MKNSNDVKNSFIKSVYNAIFENINIQTYGSHDGKKVMRIFNIRHMNPECVHYVDSKEDISLSNFLFKVNMKIYDEEMDHYANYFTWYSLIDLWNENWHHISNDYYIEISKKVHEKLKEE